ncbi:alpha/beta hydrolase [Sphingobacterium multivorum]|uniref:Alpha/beta hydrolase n=1 Tax=Sphingobacterium multivorum TaxID=28454 RepID=A0ABX7CWM3_SPHMU|nr:alpha/beta hydrolase-fold protein [Sphingobacterium multivorum]QQT54577.1 alpha/beta hydrolase [Sphingobacterium multivorum]
MMKIIPHIVWLLCILSFNPVKGQDIAIGIKTQLKSEILNEDRTLLISVPESYENSPKTNYPVIYILDGETNFNYLSSVYHYLSREPFGILPAAILVGITNNDRTRDLTPTATAKEKEFSGKRQAGFKGSGGNEAFMNFMGNELFPFMEKNYRSNGFKVLVGHSFGGLTAINNLLTAPMFNAYIANDPSLWWDNELLIRKGENTQQDFKGIRLFLAQANNGRVRNVKDDEHEIAIGKFKALLEAGRLKDLKWKYAFYEEDDHGTVPLPGNNDGLRFIFAPYRWNVRNALKDPATIRQHFDQLSADMGYEFRPTQLFFKKLIEIATERSTPRVVEQIKTIQQHYYPQ